MTGCCNDRIVVTYALRRQEHCALFDVLAAIPKGPQRAAKLRALIFVGFERRGSEAERRAGEEERATPQPPLAALFDELLDGRVE